jgi:hypothetical protein
MYLKILLISMFIFSVEAYEPFRFQPTEEMRDNIYSTVADGDYSYLIKLLDEGMNPNGDFWDDETILISYADIGSNPSEQEVKESLNVMQILLERGADPNHYSKSGANFPALVVSRLDQLELLHRYGADLNQKSRDGINKPLQWYYDRKPKLLNYLRENNVRPTCEAAEAAENRGKASEEYLVSWFEQYGMKYGECFQFGL